MPPKRSRKTSEKAEPPKSAVPAIEKVTIRDFKSLSGPTPHEIRIAPLTVLAGANSSGKSSAMQPLLLLKQTLEATYDPGPLLLHGPQVRLASTSQIRPVGQDSDTFSIGLDLQDGSRLYWTFRFASDHQLDLAEMEIGNSQEISVLREGMTSDEIEAQLPSFLEWQSALWRRLWNSLKYRIKRDRCFLGVEFSHVDDAIQVDSQQLTGEFNKTISELIHLAGLRGNPERSYGVSGVGPTMPGTFESYVASLILEWQRSEDPRLLQLNQALADLGLTWKVAARQLDASAVELKVGRLPKNHNGGQDLVNIADVGFGVSQALPIVVALINARPGQLVYIEQPEIHLHPKAQEAMAGLLAAAAKRGVRVVIETHSATLLVALQTLIAAGELDPQSAVFHWFSRDAHGATQITSVTPDESGAYGDWPEDFSSTQLGVDQKYIAAVEARLFPRNS